MYWSGARGRARSLRSSVAFGAFAPAVKCLEGRDIIPGARCQSFIELCEADPRAMMSMRTAEFELGMISENFADHLRIAVSGSPLQRRHLVRTTSVDRPAGSEHETKGIGVVLRGVG
jgi:hypothetical protein